MDLLGFALAVLLIELTPGPNMAWLATMAMVEGRRAGLAATAGVAIGLAINGAMAAIGLTALIASDVALWAGLRWAGAAMMMWLAVQAWRDSTEISSAALPRGRTMARHFSSGVAINLLNPKAFLFYVVVAPQFLNHQPTLLQALTLTATSVSIATLVHLTLVGGAAQLHGWVADPRRTRTIRRIMAVLLLCVAMWFLAGA